MELHNWKKSNGALLPKQQLVRSLDAPFFQSQWWKLVFNPIQYQAPAAIAELIASEKFQFRQLFMQIKTEHIIFVTKINAY